MSEARRGDFVTARLRGKPREEIRQGVLLFLGHHYGAMIGVSGQVYVIEPDVNIVPDENLFGREAEFVAEFRRRHVPS